MELSLWIRPNGSQLLVDESYPASVAVAHGAGCRPVSQTQVYDWLDLKAKAAIEEGREALLALGSDQLRTMIEAWNIEHEEEVIQLRNTRKPASLLDMLLEAWGLAADD